MKCWCVLLFVMAFLNRSLGQEMTVYNPMASSGGIYQKEQLWTLIVTNLHTAPKTGQLSLTVLNKASGQQVLTAISRLLIFQPGTRQVQVSEVMPVVYNALNADVDLTGGFLLPAGAYKLCYEVIGEKGLLFASSCTDVRVEVLSPPQLVLPANKSAIRQAELAFNWMPPVPANLLKNCAYDLKLVEIATGQTAAEAVRDNMPLYTAAKIKQTMLVYPASAIGLKRGVQYAWQVVANSGSTSIPSEAWNFTITEDNAAAPGSETSSYVKLARSNESQSYAVTGNQLRFSYINDGSDSLFSMKIIDHGSREEAKVYTLTEEQVPVLRPGMNLVDIDLSKVARFVKGRIYEFRLTDRQGVDWKMMFEYKGKK